jgi:hypothetical protein
MFTVTRRSEIGEWIQKAKEWTGPIHLTNRRGSQVVAIRHCSKYQSSVTFSDNRDEKRYDKIEHALEDITDWLLEPEMVEGRHFKLWINQANRDCWVERLTPTRVRISFEMPTCTQGGWRKTRDLFGRRFITC